MSTNGNKSNQNGDDSDISLSQAILAPLDAIFKAQIHAGRSYINMLWQMAYPHIPVDNKGKQVTFKNAYKNDGDFIFEDEDENASNDKKYFWIDPNGNKLYLTPNNDLTAPDTFTKTDVAGNVQDANIDLSQQYRNANAVTNMHLPYQFPVNFQVVNGEVKSEYTMNIPAIAMIPTSPLGIEEATIKFAMSISGVEDHEQLTDSHTKNFASANDDAYGNKKRPWYLVKEPQSIKGNISSDVTSSSSSNIEINIKLTKSPIPAALEKSLTILTQSISVAPMPKIDTPQKNVPPPPAGNNDNTGIAGDAPQQPDTNTNE